MASLARHVSPANVASATVNFASPASFASLAGHASVASVLARRVELPNFLVHEQREIGLLGRSYQLGEVWCSMIRRRYCWLQENGEVDWRDDDRQASE